MTKSLDQILFQFYAQNDGPADHRPAPGHRLGHAHGPDAAPRPARQPLRLRRRLRHGAEPLPDPGGDRLPADGARHRRADAGLHPHPGLGPLHRARAPGRPQARRAGAHLQPDDRNASRAGPRATRGAPHRGRGGVPPEPPQGGRGERPDRPQRPAPGLGPQPDPAGGGTPCGSRGRGEEVRPSHRPLARAGRLGLDQGARKSPWTATPSAGPCVRRPDRA
jgi:hypothetical protein